MWHNWSRELRCDPVRVEKPADDAQVADAIRRAGERGETLRPVGAGHSFTPLAVTDGVHLDLSLLDAVVHADRDAGLVRVQAGIRLHELTAQLERRGLAMENLGDIDRQALAGALATGTHGTGATLGALASQVEALTLVDGRGEVHELRREEFHELRRGEVHELRRGEVHEQRRGQEHHPRRGANDAAEVEPAAKDDAFLAAVVGLGAVGVVTEVTLRVLPAYTLRAEDRVEPLEAVLDRFHDRAATHRHFEAYAFPYSDLAWTRTNDVVADRPRPRHRARAWAEDRLLTTYAFEGLCRLGGRVPGTIPTLNRLTSRLAGGGVRVDASHRVFASARDVRFTEMELSLHRDEGIDFVREVLATIEQERFPVVFPIELRTTASDDALLSTSHGRDSLYVAVHNHVGLPYADYFDAVWEIASRYTEVRPHWGKRHPAGAEELAPRYPAWGRFAQVRRRFDPRSVFVNDHLAEVLGPVGGDAAGAGLRETRP